MYKFNLEKLEYYRVLEKLSEFCHTFLGKELAKNLLPSNNKEDVQNLLEETNEAVNLIDRISTPPNLEFEDITFYIKLLENSSSLTVKGLLDIANILEISNNLREYFSEVENKNDFELLNSYFSCLYSNNFILAKIKNSIIDENTISDNSSQTLANIRRKKSKLEQDIKNTLMNIIHSSKYAKYIQENVVTLRNDRYVIPVKQEYRSLIKGFIHDYSSTGSTVFIEPLSVFELNNELNNLKNEENLEIEKILFNLSSMLFQYTEELKCDMQTIGKLDFIFAKANFSKSINGTCPTISKTKSINLINARHPLIDKKKVVPISINLGIDFILLVITGPNTGGKTVALKTVGLLELMACSGLNIPCDEKSSIYVFDEIFADIGDDQSITNSLSTFSSHIINVSSILKCATPNSLILLDELGSGTDPLEGSALAISILEYIKSKKILAIATTHYQELKQYAILNKEAQNASVEFNLETLTPTYKLLLGIPGKSNAFAISKKLRY